MRWREGKFIDIGDQLQSSKTHQSKYGVNAKILGRCVTTELNLRVRRKIESRLHGILRFHRWSDGNHHRYSAQGETGDVISLRLITDTRQACTDRELSYNTKLIRSPDYINYGQ
jgi:hypothetical protein